MRAITHGDIVAAASVLGPLSVNCRAEAIKALLWKAHVADCYRKRLGRVHPWGNGSLLSAVLQTTPLRREPWLSDKTHLEAMAAVVDALLVWRCRGM
jgi:hypothetical protein